MISTMGLLSGGLIRCLGLIVPQAQCICAAERQIAEAPRYGLHASHHVTNTLNHSDIPHG